MFSIAIFRRTGRRCAMCWMQGGGISEVRFLKDSMTDAEDEAMRGAHLFAPVIMQMRAAPSWNSGQKCFEFE